MLDGWPSGKAVDCRSADPAFESRSVLMVLVLAYSLSKVVGGSTPFVARWLNYAAIDPGGCPVVRGHLRPSEAPLSNRKEKTRKIT